MLTFTTPVIDRKTQLAIWHEAGNQQLVEKKCKDCKGTGYLGKFRCSSCKGSGKAVTLIHKVYLGELEMTVASPVEIGPVLATADTSGGNAGNWTCEFTPQILNVGTTQCEVLKIVVKCPKGSLVLCSVYVDTDVWASGIPANDNTWTKEIDNELVIGPEQSLYFYFNNTDTDKRPSSVTIWLAPVSSAAGE